ncbi:MAG: AMP-binding protein, partial [Nonomuraea sp.]|nr:AMP-binding protein [Nonomuraea sp.]
MPEPLIAQVARWARDLPDAPAYVFADYLGDGSRHTLTWGQADLRARALAVRLSELAGPGERAAILVPQGLDHVVALLGAMYAGLVSVPRASSSDALVMTHSAAPVQARGRPVVVVDEVPDTLAGQWQDRRADPDEVACLLDGRVEITHGNLAAAAARLLDAFQPASWVSWLPLSHGLGLVPTVALPAASGGRAVFMDPAAFVLRPARWLELLGEHPGCCTAAPNFAFEYAAARVTAAERAVLDLSGVRVMLNGAEPVRPGTIDAFHAAFAGCGLRPESHTPCYGPAEASGFAAAMERDAVPVVTDFDRDALRGGRGVPYGMGARSTHVSCGRPDPRTLAIFGADGARLPDGHVGEIRVRGPHAAAGGSLMAAGWVRTGDTGL